MTKAIHLICIKDAQGKPTNVEFHGETKTFTSGYWDISEDQAKSLINGWLYLHTTKKEPSYYGGFITGFKHVNRTDVAHTDRIALIFQPKFEAKNKSWRHHDHPRAWTSGLIDADFPHELENATAKI